MSYTTERGFEISRQTPEKKLVFLVLMKNILLLKNQLKTVHFQTEFIDNKRKL